MNILVTGSAGFIGGHLWRLLHTMGHTLTLFDRETTMPDGHVWPNESCVERLKNLTVVKADLSNQLALLKAFEVSRPEVVFHLAAAKSVPESFKNPSWYVAANVLGTGSLLTCCRTFGVRRVVMASSSSVYGPQAGELHVGIPLNPQSPYGASKAAMEHVASVFRMGYGIETVCLRYFNVYGPGQAAPGALFPSIRRAYETSEPMPVYNHGRCVRHWTYVDDCVLRTMHYGFAHHTEIEPVVNIAGNRPASVNEILEIAARVVGRPVPHRMEGARQGDVDRTESVMEPGVTSKLLEAGIEATLGDLV